MIAAYEVELRHAGGYAALAVQPHLGRDIGVGHRYRGGKQRGLQAEPLAGRQRGGAFQVLLEVVEEAGRVGHYFAYHLHALGFPVYAGKGGAFNQE
jgi:hypothetical protein